MSSKKSRNTFEILLSYLPDRTGEIFLEQWRAYPCNIYISMPRKTKLGDFRAGMARELPTISVNADLNKELFLMTLVHELAHVVTWSKHKDDVKPHGREWKNDYRELLLPYVNSKVLGEEHDMLLRDHIKKAPASVISDIALYRALENSRNSNTLYLEEVEENVTFLLNNRTFKKGRKRRTRFECLDLQNRRMYLVHGFAEIELAS